MKKLPYEAVTQTGDRFIFEFPLHQDTASPVRVNQLLSAILDRVDAEVALTGDTSNGDVLQALAMALAVRTRMIHASSTQTTEIAKKLLTDSLAAAAEAPRQSPVQGHA